MAETTTIRMTMPLAWLGPGHSRTAIRGFCGVLATLVLWQAVHSFGLLPKQYFPSVGETARAIFSAVGRGATWSAVGSTMSGWAAGFVIAVCLATPLGFLIGSVKPIHQALRVLIEFVRPIPPVALIPVTVILFSSGFQMKAFLVAFGTFWPLLFQAIYGVRDVDPVARDTAKVYGLGRFAIFRNVVFPSALPYVATGLRIAASIGLILAVTTELVVGVPGLGRSITDAQAGGDVARMYALIILTGVIGVIVNLVLRTIEDHVLQWHVSKRMTVRP